MPKCLDCGSEELRAVLDIQKQMPLTARGFGVKIANQVITGLDLREHWNQQQERAIVCAECGANHTYFVSDDKLCIMRENGWETEDQSDQHQSA